MFDASLDNIKYNAFLHLAIVLFISVYVFHTMEKVCYCYGARRLQGASYPIGVLTPLVGQESPSGQYI